MESLSAEPANSVGGLPVVSYSLATSSKVSVAIYDAQGQIVRQLLLAADREAGEHSEPWDGLDDRGKALPAGEYSWKMLTSQGLRAEWMAALGSHLTPPWQIMPGNHVGAVTAVLADNGNLFVMGGCSECVPAMARIERTGKVLWHSSDLQESNNDCGTGLADGKLFTFVGNAKVLAIDPATGKGLWKVSTDWHDPKQAWLPGSDVLSLAARDQELVIANKDLNLVRWLEPADGSVLDEATVPAPSALALGKDGSLLVASRTSIVRVSRANKTPQPVVTGLVAPARIAVDVARGDLLVAEAGNTQQIKRFASDGRLLKTYGRPGGRQFGPYDPSDFRGVTGLLADRDGGFIVVEGRAAPRRVGFFDQHGKCLQEWHGGVHYANGGAPDPDDVSIAWYHSGSGEVVKAKIDYQAKTYRVLETYKLFEIGNGIITGGNMMDNFVVRRYRGRTYLVNTSTEPRMVLVDEARRRLVPVLSAKYRLDHDWARPQYTPLVYLEAYFGGPVPENPKYGSIPDAANRQSVMWSDLNDDGLPSADEMFWSPLASRLWACGRVWTDSEMNLYEMNERPMKWTPKRFTTRGAPVYGAWTDWKPIGDRPPWFDPIKVSWPAGSAVMPLPDGGLVGFFNNTENPFGKGLGSEGLGGNYIVKWRKDGSLAWCTGFHSPDFGCGPGQARFIWHILGTAHGCVMFTDMQCYYSGIDNLVHVWDTDGLWVGRLLERPDLDAAPRPAYALATENFGGTMVEVTRRNKATGLNVGDVLFFGSGQNVTSVYRITGWDKIRRRNGRVTLTPAHAETAKSTAFKVAAIRGSAGRLSKMKKFTAATLPLLGQPPVLDGRLDDEAWKAAGRVDDFRIVPAEEEGEPLPTTVLTGYDETNLYLAVRCREDQMDQLRAVGSPMHLDDSVELFLDPGCTRSKYFQIMVNPKGDSYVGEGWNPRPEIKIQTKAGKDPDAWIVELAVPWKTINAQPPKAGQALGFNAVRNHFAGAEWHSDWSPLRGNLNHTPGYFGTLYAGKDLPRDALALSQGQAFIRNLHDTTIALDGNLADWQGTRPLKILDGSKAVADVYLGWKADGLYVAFDVTTDRPWKNAAGLEMAFHGGACVDLSVAPAEAAEKNAPGAVRFLAFPEEDRVQVAEFMPKLTADLQESDQATRLYHTDAQGDNLLERVALLADGSATAKLKPDGKGYIVEMRLPSHPPLMLRSAQKLRLDASVILANTDGNRAEMRLPWFSTSGDDLFVATDVVVETTLRPANWGQAELE